MTFPTPPEGRGRHAEPGTPGQSLSEWAAALPRQNAAARPAPTTAETPGPVAPPRRRAGVIDREHAADFPIADYARHSSSDDDDRTGRLPGVGGAPTPAEPPFPAGTHPSAPLPPRPAGTWSRLQRRGDVPPDDEATVAQPAVASPPPPPAVDDVPRDASTDHPAEDAYAEDDATGGLEVIVDEETPRRGRRARRAAERASAAEHQDAHQDEHHEHDDHEHDDADHHDDPDGLLVGGSPGRAAGRRRRRRSPLAVVLSLVVLVGLVGGIVFGAKALLGLVNPADEDFTGAGTGSVQVRVEDGDTLSDIGRTLVDADVIASVGPFVAAAESQPAAMGIQPGVYGMRLQMSGQAALDLLLDPASRLFSRVTIPEGFTVTRVLERLSEETDTPLEELNRVAVDPVAVGLPPQANGLLEGWLYPATYEFEPETTPEQMLQQMVARTVETLDSLGVPPEQRLTVLTKASLVQAEAALPQDMGMVAQVLENRLAIGMRLQLDSTVNYASGNDGVTTTAEDRANPSPYNTYYAQGLPPGAIGNPGEDAINAVLNPTPGPWIYFVTVNPDTGETRFAVTDAEHAENVALFQQWLRANPD